MQYNYTTIKALAAQTPGVRITDLIALAPKNDPFYQGTEGDIAKGTWFAALWRQFGYVRGVHLRRAHYQIISQNPPVQRPDGVLYTNTESCWDYLNEASKCARYLGLVDPAAFVDRRNPDPVIYARYWDDPTPSYGVHGSWGFDLALPDFPELPHLGTSGYNGDLQPWHLEIWIEKTTMQDVLAPLCATYGANLVMGAGELSITAVLELLRRVRQAQRSVFIGYVSDADPAGVGMPVSVARKIEFYARQMGLRERVILQPIALTAAQVAAYGLPRVPIKDSELRKGKFEDIHGQGAVELDALEALRPGELARIVEAAIAPYYDAEIAERAQEQRQALQEALDEAQVEALAELQPEIAAAQAAYQELAEKMAEDFTALRERLDTLRQGINERLAAVTVDVDEFPLPEPEIDPPDPADGILFDSERPYLDQLSYYQAYRAGELESGNGNGYH